MAKMEIEDAVADEQNDWNAKKLNDTPFLQLRVGKNWD
jgi:hypothetical protein